MRSEFFLRLLAALAIGLGAWGMVVFTGLARPASGGFAALLPFAVGGGAVGLVSVGSLVTWPCRWIQNRIRLIPAQTFLAASAGLLIALVLSALLALPLSRLPGWWGTLSPIVVAVVLSYLAVTIMTARGRDIFQAVGAAGGLATPPGETRNGQLILDTNAIIDGRIADISQTGFIQGTFIIPRFVLDELRHIADSQDSMRRTRGRRGLEMLTQLQKETDVPIKIVDMDFEDTREVDVKLVKLAKALRCSIVSNDYNLNQVAALQGVRVLNINELANAVKPVVLPGEDMTLQIVQEGKEAGQGVGFLDDGTMVVVEGGRRYVGSAISVAVTRVLQTAAGRMIFAQPREPDGKTRR